MCGWFYEMETNILANSDSKYVNGFALKCVDGIAK